MARLARVDEPARNPTLQTVRARASAQHHASDARVAALAASVAVRLVCALDTYASESRVQRPHERLCVIEVETSSWGDHEPVMRERLRGKKRR